MFRCPKMNFSHVTNVAIDWSLDNIVNISYPNMYFLYDSINTPNGAPLRESGSILIRIPCDCST